MAAKDTEMQVKGIFAQSKTSMENTIWAIPPGKESPMISCQQRVLFLLSHKTQEKPVKKTIDKPRATMNKRVYVWGEPLMSYRLFRMVIYLFLRFRLR